MGLKAEDIAVHTASDVVKHQRSEKGLTYDRRRKAFAEKIRAKDPGALALVEEVSKHLWQQKAVTPNAVHANTFLTDVSVQYANDEFIGERLMPVVQVDKRSDIYATYEKRDRLGVYDDTIGPRGDANEIEENRGQDNYSVRDRALQNFTPAETVDNQDAIFDEMLDLTESVADNLALNREVRIAGIMTSTSSYAAGNFATLSGTDRWDDASGGNPIKNIQDAIASLWRGKGQTDIVGFTSLDVFNVLVRHAKLLDLFKYTRGGLITQQQLAALFGLSELYVGAARRDTANKGQTIATSRIWGNDFGVVRVARRPSKRSAHFGSTFQLRQDPMTFTWFDPKKGKSGGHYCKIGLSDDHKIVASDTGYLFKTVIAP
jgi:hypothetical protein